MDEEIFELAKENNLSLEEAEELQEFKDETGLEGDEALEIWQELNQTVGNSTTQILRSKLGWHDLQKRGIISLQINSRDLTPLESSKDMVIKLATR